MILLKNVEEPQYFHYLFKINYLQK